VSRANQKRVSDSVPDTKIVSIGQSRDTLLFQKMAKIKPPIDQGSLSKAATGGVPQCVQLIAMDARIGIHEARPLRSIRCQIMGVKMSCIASGILLPGQTIVLARDIKESGNIDRR
jgi:hypothetical protein